MRATGRPQKWQSVAIWHEATPWWTESEVARLRERHAERAPVQPPIEEPKITRIYVDERAFVLEG
jgi:hypothetical protein